MLKGKTIIIKVYNFYLNMKWHSVYDIIKSFVHLNFQIMFKVSPDFQIMTWYKIISQVLQMMTCPL
jgi:hypothetical protein